MFRRDVERSEVVEILLDMWALGDGEPHLAEDCDDLVDRLADRMDAAGCGRRYREGYVGTLHGEALVERGFAECSLTILKALADFISQRIELRADLAPLVGPDLAEAAHQTRYRPVAAEQVDPDLLERIERWRGSDLAQKLARVRRSVFHYSSPARKRGRTMRPLRSQ